KLQAKEKKKPGTMAKVFATHPVVGDRIDKVNALLARFPDRGEYTINTSEFNQVKNRLISQTNARAMISGRGGSGSAESDSKRPTLKRRQPAPPDGADTGTTGDQPPASDRPTLRKRTDTGDPSKTEETAKPTPSPKPTPKG